MLFKAFNLITSYELDSITDKQFAMEAQTINIRDISNTTTIDDVIRMVLHNDVTDLSQYALFVVRGKKETRVRTKESLRQLLESNTNNAILTVKRKVKTKPKGSAVLKAKNTLNCLKAMFSRGSTRQQNNLNSTQTRNMNDEKNCVSKCTGDKLTDIENILQSETILMTKSPAAEFFGKVELFRRFMKDVNDSIHDVSESRNDVNNSIISTSESSNEVINAAAFITKNKIDQDTFVLSFASLQETFETTGAASRFNEAFTQQSGHGSTFIEAGNDTTHYIEELNNAFTRGETHLPF